MHVATKHLNLLLIKMQFESSRSTERVLPAVSHTLALFSSFLLSLSCSRIDDSYVRV